MEIVNELEKRIELLQERLDKCKAKTKESIDYINDSHIGITKYSEEIMSILSKIDAYKDAIIIIKYYESK